MEFHRQVQRDERRRRVLTKEVLDASPGSDTARDTAAGTSSLRAGRKPVHKYGAAKFMDGQRRVVDLIPQRYPVLLLIFLVGLTLIAGLEALYLWMPALAAHTTDGRVAAFDLDSEGSLGACYSTATLWLAGVLALFIYSVRRHKEDDYQGRYRIFWAALGWTLSVSTKPPACTRA